MQFLRHLLLAALLASAAVPAHAEGFDLPGVSDDAAKLVRSLAARFPAGGTASDRRQSEARAAAAAARNDWTAAAAAFEDRVGQGQLTYALWMRVADAEARRTPPDNARALQFAYQAYNAADKPEDQAAALALGARALTAQNRPAQAGILLQSALELTPNDTALASALDAANKAAGLLVRKVTVTENADPPRACIQFNVPPSRRNDMHPEDWVRLDPPVPTAAITRENDSICVSGLPLAATTTAILRAGLPATGGLTLTKDTPVALTLGNRDPLLVFNNQLFILPRFQAPRLTLTSTNVNAVKISIALFTERTLLPWSRDHTLGQTIDAYVAGNLDKSTTRIVWTGRAEIPGFRANALLHTVLPLPATAMTAPGLYAVSVQPETGQSIGEGSGVGAVQPILQTDLAPTVWRGTDGLTVQLRSYADAATRPGVALRLMAQNNDVLAEATTDTQGLARFPAPLLHGEGVMAPSAIQATAPLPSGGTDFTTINLEAAAFDLSDRGVSGTPQPGPLDAFVWTDRGIYRPAETIHLSALLRDDAGAPVDRPAHLRILRPNGETFWDEVAKPTGGGSLQADATLSQGAPVGIWTVQVLDDPKGAPLNTATFKVDAFVPDRMAVTLGALPAQLAAGPPQPVAVDARFLYGAPAANLTGSATIRLGFAPAPPALDGFDIGLVDEAFAPDATTIDLPVTDDQGHTSLPLRLAALPDATHPIQAKLDVEVDDPSGRASRVAATIPVRSAAPLIGIRRQFKGSVDAGAEAGFDIAAIGPDGRRIPLQANIRLIREKPDWRLVTNGSLTSYQTVWRDDPLETHPVTIPADGLLHFARKLDFGRYRLEVAQKDGLAATSIRFRSGWATSDAPDVPDRADVSADRQSYAPGDTAHIHIVAPFPGPATLLVLTNTVHTLRTLDIPADGTTVDVPVDAAWGPGAYIAVHVFQGGAQPGQKDAKRPDRAIGLVWAAIDPATRRLPLAIEAPDIVRPRLTAHATIRTTPGAWVSVAAIDEGILRLTDFHTPDPGTWFLGRRALGIDIRDDWGRLIAPADANDPATLLSQGGDESASRRPNIPQQIVSLFQPPRQADAQGVVDMPLPFPDFNGQVRIMAVAWDGTKLASAAQDIIVRDQLIADPLLPRFLAPGDTARMAILLQNLDLPAGTVTVAASADGPLSIQGGATATIALAAPNQPGASATPTLTLHAEGAGQGHVRLDVSGPNGFHVLHEATLDIHSARSRDSLITAADLPPGVTTPLTPDTASFIPGTWRSSAIFGSPVRYDLAALIRSLDTYPLLCLEQAASKGLPLAILPDGDAAGPNRAARLQHMVDTVLDHQRFDGAFGLWSASDAAEPWLSLYATEFLLRAKRANATVGAAALQDALKSANDGLSNGGDSPESRAQQAYRLYVLALAGQPKAGAARVLFETLDKLPTPLAKAQLGAALALGNDRPRAEQAFAAALDAPARRAWTYDYGDAMRDQAATATLLQDTGLLPQRLSALLARLPGADTKPAALNTQDQAWLTAAAATIGRTGTPTRISLDGRAQPPAPVVTVALTGAANALNTGDRAVWQTTSITGILNKPPGPSQSGMRVTRRFFNRDGSTLDLDHLRQNTVFILLLEGAASDGQPHATLLLQGLPAGWEIAGRFAAGDVPGMPWLGTLTETRASPASDDRFLAVMDLTPEAPGFRIAVRLRAVTPGNFEIPGADLSDMARPGLYARQATNRIEILPP